MLLHKHITSMKFFNRASVENLFLSAEKMLFIKPEEAKQLLKNKTLGVLFYQSSTRTRLSFETAMQKLGGAVIGFADPTMTRSEGFFHETLEDVIQVVSQLADCLIIRHFQPEFIKTLLTKPGIAPIINAGDGSNEHPTQALSDLWTIHRYYGGIDGLRIGLAGDMTTRVLRSMLLGLTLFQPKELLFLPSSGRLPKETLSLLEKTSLPWKLYQNINELLTNADVIEMLPFYLPNLNKAGNNSAPNNLATPDHYRLTKEKIEKTQSSAIILHPGPRLDEIATDVDLLPQMLYFKQAKNAVYIRMALLNKIMN
ncbi:MAG: aspartate carbamoyltransferase catalytic subunit [uncultured bacterium]|nr:MAG: aspartate carbamoyltransferase catalytic subunit [uncultured bacterium]